MTLQHLGWVDLGIAATFVVLFAWLAARAQLEVSRPLLISAMRMVVQLAVVGFVLEALFAHAAPYWVASMALVMLLLAGWEVVARQRRRLAGWWSFGLSTGSMFISSFTVTVFALIVLVQAEPWYEPRYAIPLLGMLLGNTMNGVALSQDRLIEGAWQQRDVIEARLMLGQTWQQAVAPLRRASMRSGMIPMINAMAAAGVVSLPGMMTGQILAGSPPAQAVKYQILIFLLITVGSGFATLLANRLAARRLFDERERLRVDRLVGMKLR